MLNEARRLWTAYVSALEGSLDMAKSPAARARLRAAAEECEELHDLEVDRLARALAERIPFGVLRAYACRSST
jgi:hypothetical protein